MFDIAILGAGNVGANAAFYIAERAIGSVGMYDQKDGLAQGKALDLMEAAPVRGYPFAVGAIDDERELSESKVVVIAAGAVRAPGQDRAALLTENRRIVADAAARLADYAGVVLIASEPVDELVALFVAQSGLPRTRVLGIGGHLDSQRLRMHVAQRLGVSAENVTATVVGSHDPAGMVPLFGYTRVSGVPAAALLSDDDLLHVKSATLRAADELVEGLQRSAGYYGPAAAIADLCQAVVGDTRRIVSAQVVLDGEYDQRGVALGLPLVLGAAGAVRILTPRLSDPERTAFVAAASAGRESVK